MRNIATFILATSLLALAAGKPSLQQSPSVLIISGGITSHSDGVGKSVEAYVPSTGRHCNLTDLPDARQGHTMDGRTLCGGGDDEDTAKSCLTLTDAGTWERTTTLLKYR